MEEAVTFSLGKAAADSAHKPFVFQIEDEFHAFGNFCLMEARCLNTHIDTHLKTEDKLQEFHLYRRSNFLGDAAFFSEVKLSIT